MHILKSTSNTWVHVQGLNKLLLNKNLHGSLFASGDYIAHAGWKTGMVYMQVNVLRIRGSSINGRKLAHFGYV